MITATYSGPLQAVTLDGQDLVLVPGKVITVPDCDYVQALLAVGQLTPVLPPSKAAKKATPTE